MYKTKKNYLMLLLIPALLLGYVANSQSATKTTTPYTLSPSNVTVNGSQTTWINVSPTTGSDVFTAFTGSNLGNQATLLLTFGFANETMIFMPPYKGLTRLPLANLENAVSKGTYDFALFNMNGEVISNTIKVTVN